MSKLIYFAIMSLDGFIADESGNFDWAAPDEEVHAFINDLVRPAGTHLYGRRMYEVMTAWETEPSLAEDSPISADFASMWQAAEKVVYSRTLESVVTQRTRLERDFDPAAVRALLDSASSDALIGGPELAGHAFRAGLIDECQLFVVPWIVGGGNAALPSGIRRSLELNDLHRFRSGVVYLNYAVSRES
jgi:dihydrofolate reductase